MLLGVAVAAGVGYELTDGRDAAVVVAAAALVYLAAAAAKHRDAAGPAFGVTFVVITVAKLTETETETETETDAVPWMLALAGVALVLGLVRGATRPGWALPLQTLAMVVFGGLAILAGRAGPTVGGLVVAALLLAHAG